MRAMILAAGRGERMMPLTQHTPKPMLNVGGKPLLQHHIENLVAAGINNIVINYAWCGEQIISYFGNGNAFGANIVYSDESDGALETAGGIKKALPLLLAVDEVANTRLEKDNANDVFLVVNGDVFCEFDFKQLLPFNDEQEACIWLVENPQHNLKGDFALSENNIVENKKDSEKSYTFSGIALYRASFFNELFNQCNEGEKCVALGPMLRKAAEQRKLQGRIITALWSDIGTPERLVEINQRIIGRN